MKRAGRCGSGFVCRLPQHPSHVLFAVSYHASVGVLRECFRMHACLHANVQTCFPLSLSLSLSPSLSPSLSNGSVDLSSADSLNHTRTHTDTLTHTKSLSLSLSLLLSGYKYTKVYPQEIIWHSTCKHVCWNLQCERCDSFLQPRDGDYRQQISQLALHSL